MVDFGGIPPLKMQALQNAAQNMINNPSIAQHIQNLLAQFQQRPQQRPQQLPQQQYAPNDFSYHPNQGPPWQGILNDGVYRGQPQQHMWDDLVYHPGEVPPWANIALAAQQRLGSMFGG